MTSRLKAHLSKILKDIDGSETLMSISSSKYDRRMCLNADVCV